MSLSLPAKTIIYFLGPKLIDIAADIVQSNINADNLAAIKAKLYEVATNLTGRTHFTWDDDLAQVLLDTITDPDSYQEWGDAILDIVESWVAASETEWDDKLILPAIDAFRDVAGIPDDDDTEGATDSE